MYTQHKFQKLRIKDELKYLYTKKRGGGTKEEKYLKNVYILIAT